MVGAAVVLLLHCRKFLLLIPTAYYSLTPEVTSNLVLPLINFVRLEVC